MQLLLHRCPRYSLPERYDMWGGQMNDQNHYPSFNLLSANSKLQYMN